MSQDPWSWYARMIESDRNMQQQGAENLMAGLTSAVDSIAGAYMKSEEQKAKGRAFKNTFNVIAPSLNMTTDKLAEVVGKDALKNDSDWYHASETFMPILPSLLNLQLGQQKMGVQQQQPFVNAGLKNAANIAGGNATYTPPAGMSPVEPPLPTKDPAAADAPLPAVTGAPAPAPTPAQTMPGGSQSKEAYNRWLRSQGLPPIP